MPKAPEAIKPDMSTGWPGGLIIQTRNRET